MPDHTTQHQVDNRTAGVVEAAERYRYRLREQRPATSGPVIPSQPDTDDEPEIIRSVN